MKHIELALQVANEERERMRDRLTVISSAQSLPPLKTDEPQPARPATLRSAQTSPAEARADKAAALAAAARAEQPPLKQRLETHLQAAIRRAREQVGAAKASAEPPVLTARVGRGHEQLQSAKAAQAAAAHAAAEQTRTREAARNAEARIHAAAQRVQAAARRHEPQSSAQRARHQAPQPGAQRAARHEPLPNVPARHKPPLDLTSIVYSETRVLDLPRSAFEAARIVSGDGEDSVTRAYKLLRTQVLHRMQQKNWRTLAVVSAGDSEGKTLTAINLGIALAGSVQHTVMLVDCDWRRPSVHKYFDYEPEHDIASYLDGRVPMSEAIVNPGIPRFCFLPCRAPIAQSSERLGSTQVGSLVEELRSKYANRIVLFDLPPMLLTDDALSFLPHVDCALVVVEENRTRHDELEQTLEMIGRDKLLGTVLNKSSQKRAGY